MTDEKKIDLYTDYLTSSFGATVSVPVAFDLVIKIEEYIDAKTKKEKRRSTVRKNQRYRMLLRVAVHNQIRFRYVLNDSWFASTENMKYIKHDLDKEFVMPLRSNRKKVNIFQLRT